MVGNKQRSILVVDDDDAVRRVVVLVLRLEGYRVVEATDGDDGVRQLGDESFDMLSTDECMPGTSMSELVSRFRDINPGAPVLVCSGHLETTCSEPPRGDEIVYLSKPFSTSQLRSTVARMLARSSRVPHAKSA